MTSEVLEHTPETLTRRRATAEEFWALPESMLPAEYVNGEIVMAPTPTAAHQRASAKIFVALDKYVTENGLGEMFYAPLDIILPSGDVVQPDILYLTNEVWERVKTTPRIHAAPSFLVEILSPGSIRHDKVTKRSLYEKNGVLEYWIVDLKAKSVTQLVLRRKRYVLTELGEADTISSSVLAGFGMNVGELLGLK
jgi:Uma2 family endonuclease